MALLKVNHLQKTYTTRLGGNKVDALKDVNFEVEKGEYVAIMGESGSGKTTLLNIIATVDRATAGEVFLDILLGNSQNNQMNLSEIKDKDLAKFRRDNLGFVFQDFNLLDTFTLEDNIYLPLVLAGKDYKEMSVRLNKIARQLGISDILKKYPYEVSGGQKQRTAVARAIITNPSLLLADEPTGALDSKSAAELLKIFKVIHEEGQTILMVTHSIKAASNADRVLFIKDGNIYHQIYKGAMSNDEMYKKISDTLTVLLKGEISYE